MPTVDISAQHSKAERPFFGLDVILEELLEHPLREHVVIARIVRSGLSVNDTKGTSTPRVRPLHIEVIVDGVDQKEALQILDRAYRRRTGRADMPPGDLFNSDGPGDGELAGQSTLGEHLADAEQTDAGQAEAGDVEQADQVDPTAGPHFSDIDNDGLWPGDAGYQPGKG